MGSFIGIFYLLVVASAIWGFFDANKLRAKGASSKDVGGGPVGVFITFLIIWPIAFPFYLYKRSVFLNKLN